jgi:hypothetical protein
MTIPTIIKTVPDNDDTDDNKTVPDNDDTDDNKSA